ncbi:MAG: phosphopentomutase, partial [Spartobacteria bacterium]|nr:phosphopentomutase [Spartobacteria bacterium]
MKAILIILDSVGIGEAPDAATYNDAGSATLPHLAEAVGGLSVPTLQAMGIGNIPAMLPGGIPIPGVEPCEAPIASFGAMQEVSAGKDTITGHWEIAGLEINPGFHVFPPESPSFPKDLVETFEKQTGRGTIGHKASSGTVILDELGEEHMKTGKWIIYTSADSVFQIAAHEEIIPVPELYNGCEIARKLCDTYKVGRVIARPFIGQPGAFTRTENRKDYAYTPEERTILEVIKDAGIPVYAVGKIEDIYANRGITESNHTGNTKASQEMVDRWTAEKEHGLIIANYIDFDMLYGHRRDAEGYAEAVVQSDQWLASYLPKLTENDVLIITADHGNDPTYAGSDHTREYVPLLVYQPGKPGKSLGIRNGFYDIAQSLATFFKLPPMPRGRTFL